MRAKRVLLAASIVLVGCGDRHHDVNLILGGGPTNMHGFNCKLDADDTHSLYERGFDVASSLVVDFIRFDRNPTCQTTAMLGLCCNGGCDLVGRACVDLPAFDSQGSLRKALDALDSTTVLDGAPDGEVMIRAIAVARACAAVPCVGDGLASCAEPALPDAEIFGCVWSCSQRLDDVDGALQLDLEVINASCEQAVTYCAAPEFDDPVACTALGL